MRSVIAKVWEGSEETRVVSTFTKQMLEFQDVVASIERSKSDTIQKYHDNLSQTLPSLDAARVRRKAESVFLFETSKSLKTPLLNLILSSREYADWVVTTRQVPKGKAKALEMAVRLVSNDIRFTKPVLDWWSENRSRFELLLAASTWNPREVSHSGDSEDLNTSKSQSVKIGGFVVHNVVGFDPVRFSPFLELLHQAQRVLQGTKAHTVAYGDVFVVGRFYENKTLAWYRNSSDDVYLRPFQPEKAENLYVLLHELGHRHYHRILNPDQRDAVGVLYNNLLSPKVDPPKVGDVFPLSVSGRPGVVHTVVGIERGQYVLSPTGVAPVRKVLDIMSEKLTKAGFPTQYARTSPGEFYAECFAGYVLGKLKPDLERDFRRVSGL